MNRRTWLVLLDFFGMVGGAGSSTANPLANDGSSPATQLHLHCPNQTAGDRQESFKSKRGQQECPAYNLTCRFHSKLAKVHMNYPAAKTQLGVIQLSEADFQVTMDTNNSSEPMVMSLSSTELKLSDSTIFYSQLYDQRLNIRPLNGQLNSSVDNIPRIELNILKHRTDDFSLLRDYDLKMDISIGAQFQTSYIHTHRYFCALLDFWMNYAELQDQVFKRNEGTVLKCLPPEPQKTRCALNVCLNGGLELILPLNQLCQEVIVFNAGRIRIDNCFERASQIEVLQEQMVKQSAADVDDYDCLLEAMKVHCRDVSIGRAVRTPSKQSCSNTCFENFHFRRGSRDNFNILNRSLNFSIDVYRNLSALFSHSVPDLTIITSLEDPDTIPIELLHLPERTAEILTSKYSTLSFRMLLNDVKFHFLTPSNTKECIFQPFAQMNLAKAKLSYDSYIDNQSEFDLICENTSLLDTRDPSNNLQPNVFTSIVSGRQSPPPSAAVAKPLVCEAHIMMRKEEAPLVTLVLMHARVLLLLDWLDRAKEFLLMNTEFVAPRDPLTSRSSTDFCTYEVPKSGVLTRSISHANQHYQAPTSQILAASPVHTITLKITLKESDLVLLEQPEDPDSLALIGYVTAVVSCSDASGQMEASYEIQRINLCWCLMSSEETSKCQLTNAFSATIQIAKDQSNSATRHLSTSSLSPNSSSAKSSQGIQNIDLIHQRQKLSIELSEEVIARCCYKDFLVLRNVLEESLKRLKQGNGPVSKTTPAPAASGLQGSSSASWISKVCIKAERICLWMLDDSSQGVAIPMLRLNLYKLLLEKSVDRLQAQMSLGVDYFNQSVFGWEPLVEPWLIDRLAVQWRETHVNVDLTPGKESPLEFNLTQTFIQQANQFFYKWDTIRQSMAEKDTEKGIKQIYSRPKSDHLPYILRNETGSGLKFTTAVEELTKSRAASRRSTAKWFSVAASKSSTFEFPAKLLTQEKIDEPRLLVVKVDGWEEISPVSVDSVGTYFRVVRMAASMQAITKSSSNSAAYFARVVVAVNMDQDGRKVVTVQSALILSNRLADPILIKLDNSRVTHPDDKLELELGPSTRTCVPLKYVNAEMEVQPKCSRFKVVGHQHIDWLSSSGGGEYVRSGGSDDGSDGGRSSGVTGGRNSAGEAEYRNRLLRFSTTAPNRTVDHLYWVCVSIKKERYPELSENEYLSGHTISFIAPFTILNLLPIEVEFECGNGTGNPFHTNKYPIQSGKRLQIHSVNLDEELVFSVGSDRFHTINPANIFRSQLSKRALRGESRRIFMRMKDTQGRPLDMYGSVGIGQGGSLHLSLWVPFWMVNRSGLPLILKQEAAEHEAAGQFAEHEKAKDRNPLMFSFSDEGCPQQCCLRVGKKFMEASSEGVANSTRPTGFHPHFSRSFALSSGVQALKLVLTHKDQPAISYNIGVEVRQGTGRYKDTQVVLFTPRYRLNNQASENIFVCHRENVKNPGQHLQITSKSNVIWHDSCAQQRMICVRREGLEHSHWSCPFRIDQIGSFHVTMRDRDETPRFLRVEITLSNASFWITFSDAHYFPAPIRLENLSNVPVLYHQHYNNATSETGNQPHHRILDHHLRTICKANSSVDYAWDDLYASKLLTLQDRYAASFDRKKRTLSTSSGDNNCFTDDQELVLLALKEGKVMLGKLNTSDSSQSQLWRQAEDGCLENIGMNNRSRQGERYVLDVLDGVGRPAGFGSAGKEAGSPLMMLKRNTARDATQKWIFTKDDRIKCNLPNRYVEAKNSTLFLSPRAQTSSPSQSSRYFPDPGLIESNVKSSQYFRRQRQKPGSGVLDVQCLHVGPTLVVRITDRADHGRALEALVNKKASTTSITRSKSIPSFGGPGLLEEQSQAGGQTPLSFNATLDMKAGIGVSLINNAHEELIYLRFKGVKMHVLKQADTYQFNGHVDTLQADNQLLNTDRWQLLYCDTRSECLPDAVDSQTADGPPVKPALSIELNCTPMQHYDAFDSFRIKLCDLCILLDETLLWKIIQFVQETGTAHSVQPKALLAPPDIEPETWKKNDPANPTRRCYFGTLDLEVGNVSLSVMTVGKSSLPMELRRLKEQFNIKLVSFENALVSLPAFRQFHYFETVQFLVESLSKFYMAELKKQTLNIVVTMDAFGNPWGDVGGFVFGLGYGVTNSISKMASSMAQGVGSLTFDQQHEHMRRRMLRSQSAVGADNATALSHLYGGVKGLGVGVFGGLTAIAKNTFTATQKDGVSGIFRGVTTGAVDTVTKPLQGALDLLEGTASAFKEAVGGPLVRKSHFADHRIRLPEINSYSMSELLLDVVVLLVHMYKRERIIHRALICSEQCYILKQVNHEPGSVIQRVAYKCLKSIHPAPHTQTRTTPPGMVQIEISYSNQSSSLARRLTPISQNQPPILCMNKEVGLRLCDMILRAKQLYDHSKRTLTAVIEQQEEQEEEEEALEP
uniref:Fragile site-associated protein C-terminal domain-containing protein n=1 Tax=Ditylenchus dipsaci TaxID=166011 RepID=A0A915ER72_9BILA